MKITLGLALLASSLLSAAPLAAQNTGRNDVGLVIGGTVTPGLTAQNGEQLSFNPSLALGAEYDYRVVSRKVALSLGVDFLASPLDVKLSNPPADISPSYAYLFLTPHVRATFRPEAAFRPWLLFGGGYADFAPSTPAVGTRVSGSGSSGTLEFGAGVDTKPLLTLPLPLVHNLPIGTRFEVRDFYSGQPNYGVPVTSSQQNSVVFTGGLLLHF